uniref:Uncharacterized protein n=1 Tax=Oryza glumipatula TaxID=40148 RepID=A0A0D9YBI6_9ORYZ
MTRNRHLPHHPAPCPLTSHECNYGTMRVSHPPIHKNPETNKGASPDTAQCRAEQRFASRHCDAQPQRPQITRRARAARHTHTPARRPASRALPPRHRMRHCLPIRPRWLAAV